jgi:hypothetical protein
MDGCAGSSNLVVFIIIYKKKKNRYFFGDESAGLATPMAPGSDKS